MGSPLNRMKTASTLQPADRLEFSTATTRDGGVLIAGSARTLGCIACSRHKFAVIRTPWPWFVAGSCSATAA